MLKTLESLSRTSRRVVCGLALTGLLVAGAKSCQKTQWAAVVSSDPGKRQGPSNAPVTLVEYSDFQCPVCKNAQEPLKEILARYPGKILLIFKHFPLTRVHRWALAASIAAECAKDQGKFWPYHDLLYERQDAWSKSEKAPEEFLAFARELGLDPESFDRCRTNPLAEAAVRSDEASGDARGVDATPTFFLNEYRLVSGGQFRREAARLVEVELRKTGWKPNP